MGDILISAFYKVSVCLQQKKTKQKKENNFFDPYEVIVKFKKGLNDSHLHILLISIFIFF